jgi:hypothetical protein
VSTASFVDGCTNLTVGELCLAFCPPGNSLLQLAQPTHRLTDMIEPLGPFWNNPRHRLVVPRNDDLFPLCHAFQQFAEAGFGLKCRYSCETTSSFD